MPYERGKHKFHPGLQLSASALIALALCFGVMSLRPRQPVVAPRDEGDAVQITAAIWDPDTVGRRVYALSIVPGGVYSGAEAALARDADPVVAEHFKDVNVAWLRRAVLHEPVHRYVSFRRGSQVYWTRTALRIPEGETVLEDGASLVRARCGNRLSETPRFPVLAQGEQQPTEIDFEIPLPPEQAPLPLVGEARRRSTSTGGASPLQDSTPVVEPLSGEESDEECAPGQGGASDRPCSERRTASSETSGKPPGSGNVAPVRGFRGFSALGSTGTFLPPPSSNPALSGRDNVGTLNPDLFLPSPPQVGQQLPAPPPFLPETAGYAVFAVISPPAPGQARFEVSPNLPTSPPTGVMVPGGPPPTPQVPVLMVSSPGLLPLQGTTPNPGLFIQVSANGLTPPISGIPGRTAPLNGSSTPASSFVPGGSTPGGGSSNELDAPVPEPGSIVLLIAGLGCAVGWRARRR